MATKKVPTKTMHTSKKKNDAKKQQKTTAKVVSVKSGKSSSQITAKKSGKVKTKKVASTSMTAPTQQILVNTGAPTKRYSDLELAEFKIIIERKLEAAKKEYDYHMGLVTGKGEHSAESDGLIKISDSEVMFEKEENMRLAARQKTYIESLMNALVRIGNKTYGICIITGKLIPTARLKAVPTATKTIEAKVESDMLKVKNKLVA